MKVIYCSNANENGHCGHCEYFINDSETMSMLTLAELLHLVLDFTSCIRDSDFVVDIDAWKITCGYMYKENNGYKDSGYSESMTALQNVKDLTDKLLRKWYTSNICTRGEKLTIESTMFTIVFTEDIECFNMSLGLIVDLVKSNSYNHEEQYLNEKINDDEQLPSIELYTKQVLNSGSNTKNRKRVDSVTDTIVNELNYGINKLLYDNRPCIQYLSSAIQKEYITCDTINKWKVQLSNFIISSGVLKSKNKLSLDIAKIKVNSMLEIVDYSISFIVNNNLQDDSQEQKTVDNMIYEFQTYVLEFNMAE